MSTPSVLLGACNRPGSPARCEESNTTAMTTPVDREGPRNNKRRRISTPDTATESECKTHGSGAPGGGPAPTPTWGELYVLRTDSHSKPALREPPKFILPLIKDEYVLGRSSKCDIMINLPQCSREHLSMVKEDVIDTDSESHGLKRTVYLKLNESKSTWKTTVNGEPISNTKTTVLENGDLFSVCSRPFKILINDIGDDQKFFDRFEGAAATANVSNVNNLSIEGRPPTIRKNISSRKRKRRLRSEVNDSSLISESLIQSPLEGTPKDLKASFHKKRLQNHALTHCSFDNGGSFQGSFLLADGSIADDSFASKDANSGGGNTPSPLPMPSPEQQPSAMKSTKHSVGVPTELNRVKAVRFGAFNEEAYIQPGLACSVTPATKILPPHQSKSAQKRVQMGSMLKVGMLPSPQMSNSSANLDLGLMKQTPTRADYNGEESAPVRWGRGDPKILKVIEVIMKMPKARKPETLLSTLMTLRENIRELIKYVRDDNTSEMTTKQKGSEIMKLLTTFDWAHPVKETLKAYLKEVTISKDKNNFRGGKFSSKIKSLWDGIEYLQKNPGDVSTLRLEVVSCIISTLPISDETAKNRKEAIDECKAMFMRLAEATSVTPKDIPELVGKRLRQGLKRLVALEHHKAEEIIVQLSHKLKVTNRALLPEAAEESMRMGLKVLLNRPERMARLSAEHRNMAISSLSELVTIGSSSLTALLTSTSKELNSYGGHLDTNNAILVGISQVMAKPPKLASHEKSPTNARLTFSSFNQTFDHHQVSTMPQASICEESTIIGTSATTPSKIVRRFSKKTDITPHPMLTSRSSMNVSRIKEISQLNEEFLRDDEKSDDQDS